MNMIIAAVHDALVHDASKPMFLTGFQSVKAKQLKSGHANLVMNVNFFWRFYARLIMNNGLSLLTSTAEKNHTYWLDFFCTYLWCQNATLILLHFQPINFVKGQVPLTLPALFQTLSNSVNYFHVSDIIWHFCWPQPSSWISTFMHNMYKQNY